MFFRPPFLLPILYPDLTWKIQTDEKVMYLTFDDGPIPGPTEFVLEALRKHNARATFFCIGDNVRKHPDIYQQVLAQGHAIGNHTYNHLKGWNTTVEAYLNNISLCEQEFSFHGNLGNTLVPGEGRRLFRPPYGRIKRAQIRALGVYKIIMWDVLSHDYLKGLAPDKCLARSIHASRPGSIVVFHDSIKAERNMMYALPRFLDHFSGLGYSFKTIPIA